MKHATVRLLVLSLHLLFSLLICFFFFPAVKAYGELPENAKINETDTFGDEEGECTFDFDDQGEVDIDDI
jgi:hypothetical protein